VLRPSEVPNSCQSPIPANAQTASLGTHRPAETVVEQQRCWQGGRCENDDDVSGAHVAVRDALVMRRAQRAGHAARRG